MKQWSVGELQGLRVASRFLMGFGLLAIVVSGLILVLYMKLPPEEKNNDVHQHDIRNISIIVVVAGCAIGAGWKLRSFVKKLESQTGQSAKPFGWVP